jgi:hypothetical protein
MTHVVGVPGGRLEAAAEAVDRGLRSFTEVPWAGEDRVVSG